MFFIRKRNKLKNCGIVINRIPLQRVLTPTKFKAGIFAIFCFQISKTGFEYTITTMFVIVKSDIVNYSRA